MFKTWCALIYRVHAHHHQLRHYQGNHHQVWKRMHPRLRRGKKGSNSLQFPSSRSLSTPTDFFKSHQKIHLATTASTLSLAPSPLPQTPFLSCVKLRGLAARLYTLKALTRLRIILAYAQALVKAALRPGQTNSITIE